MQVPQFAGQLLQDSPRAPGHGAFFRVPMLCLNARAACKLLCPQWRLLLYLRAEQGPQQVHDCPGRVVQDNLHGNLDINTSEPPDSNDELQTGCSIA